MKIHVNAITLALENLPAMTKFYTGVFGLETSTENERVVILKLNNLLLTLCNEALLNQYTNISNKVGGKVFISPLILHRPQLLTNGLSKWKAMSLK